MKIVIDIPNKQYELIKQSDYNVFSILASKECMMYAIKNGMPLPAKHGRLIDYNDVDDMLCDFAKSVDISYGQIMEYVDKVPTIIPADKDADNE